MDRFIDLTIEISDHMPVHPFDDEVNLCQDKFSEKDGFNSFTLKTGMHAGTHIDAPMHLTTDNRFISEFDIGKFTGRGKLIDVRGEDIIKFRDSFDKIIEKDDIVLFFTGHSRKYGTDEYYSDHPVLDSKIADFLVKTKVKMIGMDLPSPDIHPFAIHKKLLKNDILIVENLTNLDKLLGFEDFEIIALPLKIRAEASFSRVVAGIMDRKKS